ncbi:MAG: ROK family protein, partial [Candidatus Binataceae bacterium]
MKSTPTNATKAEPEMARPRTLAVDIGGSGIKTIVLDPRGTPLTERNRIATPRRATPQEVIEVIAKLAAAQGEFERVSAGFPGVVKHGVVYTAANLGKGWPDFDLAKALTKALSRPARVTNDADIQGLGVINGRGVELVITLGTGFGSVLFAERQRIHLELGHHEFRKGRTYEDELGKR